MTTDAFRQMQLLLSQDSTGASVFGDEALMRDLAKTCATDRAAGFKIHTELRKTRSLTVFKDEFNRLIAEERANNSAEADDSVPEKTKEQLRNFVYVSYLNRWIDLRNGSMLTEEAVANRHADIMPLDPRGNPMNAARWFVRNLPASKVDGISYWPGKPRIVRENGVECVNRWRPSDIKPAKGDVSPFLALLDHLFGEDHFERDHIVKWMAHNVQKPGVKIRHTPIIIGEEGTGKGTLFKTLSLVIGIHNWVEPNDQQLTNSQFNDWAAGAQVAYIPELLVGDRRDVANRMKSLITDDRIRINTKNVSEYDIVNRINMIASSNFIDAMALGGGDRRYMPYLSKAGRLPEEFSDAYNEWLLEGGAEAISYYLANEVDISSFRPNAAAPMTESKKIVIEATRSNLVKVVEELADSMTGPFADDLVEISKCVEFVNSGRFGVKASANTMANAIKEIGGAKIGKFRHVSMVGGREQEPWVTLWAVRNADKYEGMTEDQVLAAKGLYGRQKVQGQDNVVPFTAANAAIDAGFIPSEMVRP
jgi:hypothetical protein